MASADVQQAASDGEIGCAIEYIAMPPSEPARWSRLEAAALWGVPGIFALSCIVGGVLGFRGYWLLLPLVLLGAALLHRSLRRSLRRGRRCRKAYEEWYAHRRPSAMESEMADYFGEKGFPPTAEAMRSALHQRSDGRALMERAVVVVLNGATPLADRGAHRFPPVLVCSSGMLHQTYAMLIVCWLASVLASSLGWRFTYEPSVIPNIQVVMAMLVVFAAWLNPVSHRFAPGRFERLAFSFRRHRPAVTSLVVEPGLVVSVSAEGGCGMCSDRGELAFGFAAGGPDAEERELRFWKALLSTVRAPEMPADRVAGV